jgi:prolyl-tRNA editing enzyme YbaK/EbsC (Cys-tRNA(Pro) deacylase)
MENESVKKVRAALDAAGLGDRVQELAETARTADDAAKALGAEKGAIVKSLVFVVGEQPVLALIAGDRQCKADEVRAASGFAIGGVAPVALALELPTVIDVSLKRFETVYAAAGHPSCVFPLSVPELKRLTGGIVSYAVADEPEKA